jgi:hypothetical protein
MLTAGPVSKMASQQEKAAQNSCCTVITDLDTSKWSTQKAFSCCDAILKTGPAANMRNELLVAHEKLGQLPLLTVYVVPVKGEK